MQFLSVTCVQLCTLKHTHSVPGVLLAGAPSAVEGDDFLSADACFTHRTLLLAGPCLQPLHHREGEGKRDHMTETEAILYCLFNTVSLLACTDLLQCATHRVDLWDIVRYVKGLNQYTFVELFHQIKSGKIIQNDTLHFLCVINIREFWAIEQVRQLGTQGTSIDTSINSVSSVTNERKTLTCS